MILAIDRVWLKTVKQYFTFLFTTLLQMLVTYHNFIEHILVKVLLKIEPLYMNEIIYGFKHTIVQLLGTVIYILKVSL